jgi:levansucrase
LSAAASTTTAWTREHVRSITDDGTVAPVIRIGDVEPIIPGYDAWDVGPVRLPDGRVATLAGGEVWLVLAAPAVGNPGSRHDRARLRLAARADGRWRDLGDVFAAGASLGGREWAGSALYRPDRGTVTVFYTAAGRHGEQTPTFGQRIVATTARAIGAAGAPFLSNWTEHVEVIRADGTAYMRADEEHGEAGFIKAFRDPFFFHDPATESDSLLFTGSLAGASTDFNGAIGVADADGAGWKVRPPLIHADGVNNELERPHIVVCDGRYHLFFSTQRRTFHPAVSAPTGLYGFVADRLHGPYVPLNGSGLIIQNPPSEPTQAYSWLVLNDLRVVSFVDSYDLQGRALQDVEAEGDEATRRHFGGTMAPLLQIALDGCRARLEAPSETS